ncbi:Aldehyde/histidinol dehydrogenase [Penicillium malachiteum]|uniref:Aldehyde/histidinol dehydrogenase n=1 Tax=Penicillium malachiteum TaxID=1324776 RepID=UPI002547439D|nr:Aldehyde/histidinol dehydrogenase [Penicillium malachiteum]KAJ5736220.1 Aldehyde/histidinol dehydrogenase [Penicillium malachiteum]
MSYSAPKLRDSSLFVDKNYIDGQWIDSVSGKSFNVYDPANGVFIGSCPESVAQDAETAINAAAGALPAWRSRTGRDRSRVLRRWYELVIEDKEDLATLITWENGKAGLDAAGEVQFAASFLEWFAEEAPRVYGDVIPHSQPGFRVSVLKEPIGVVGLITPWNFPAAMITRKLGPALAVGCTAVVKTAGETPFTANALLVLAERAGVPKGVINSVSALENTPEIGLALCTSNTVRKISFTGSTRVGKILMNQSSNTLKKLSLELGGNAPFIVFDDADLDLAVAGAVASKFKSSGQTCVCSNRIFVQKGIYNEFVKKLNAVVAGFKVGPGFDSKTTHGPLVTPGAADRVESLIADAVKSGAKVEAGGRRRIDIGNSPLSPDNQPIPLITLDIGQNFIEPTIMTNVTPNMRLMQEEIFGPLAPIFSFDTEDEVIDMANDCEVGLASYIFTQNIDRASRVTELLSFGMVGLNTGVMSDAPAPFGGIKHSGLGREGSRYGIED